MFKLLYFSSDWCGPCKIMGPTMQKVADEGIPVQKINIDQNQELPQRYVIRHIPTIIKIDNNGTEINRLVGNRPKEEIINFYNS